jgi:hypothetical protein
MINPISDEALELQGVISPRAIGPLPKLHNDLADGKLFTLEKHTFFNISTYSLYWSSEVLW